MNESKLEGHIILHDICGTFGELTLLFSGEHTSPKIYTKTLIVQVWMPERTYQECLINRDVMEYLFA